MKMDHLVLGDYQTNCYILRSSESETDCVIIDTGLADDQPTTYLLENNLKPMALILTHGHADHIGGIKQLRDKYPEVKVYIHSLDSEKLTRPSKNLSLVTGKIIKTEPADCLLGDGQVIAVAGMEMQVLHTPGHTPGGICLYMKNEGVVFSGDTLFADSVGRTDFPGGNATELIKSIKDKLCVLADETAVYPGHGPATTIAKEKLHNQFLQ